MYYLYNQFSPITNFFLVALSITCTFQSLYFSLCNKRAKKLWHSRTHTGTSGSDDISKYTAVLESTLIEHSQIYFIDISYALWEWSRCPYLHGLSPCISTLSKKNRHTLHFGGPQPPPRPQEIGTAHAHVPHPQWHTTSTPRGALGPLTAWPMEEKSPLPALSPTLCTVISPRSSETLCARAHAHSWALQQVSHMKLNW